MQALKNGYYWVWWHTKDKSHDWFMVRVHNGHATFIESENLKIKASEIITQRKPFIRVRGKPEHSPYAFAGIDGQERGGT